METTTLVVIVFILLLGTLLAAFYIRGTRKNNGSESPNDSTQNFSLEKLKRNLLDQLAPKVLSRLRSSINHNGSTIRPRDGHLHVNLPYEKVWIVIGPSKITLMFDNGNSYYTLEEISNYRETFLQVTRLLEDWLKKQGVDYKPLSFLK